MNVIFLKLNLSIFHSKLIGSILVWEGVIDKLKQFTDSAGYESLQLWRNQVKPADEALIKGDLDSAANVLQKAIIHARALIPYVKSEFLQNKLKKSVASAERMVKIIEAKTGALQDLQTFSETESSSLEN